MNLQKSLSSIYNAGLLINAFSAIDDMYIGNRYVTDPDNMLLVFEVEGKVRKSRPGFRWVGYEIVIPKNCTQEQIDVIVSETAAGKKVQNVRTTHRRILKD